MAKQERRLPGRELVCAPPKNGLFSPVSGEVYREAFKLLVDLRRVYPGYNDDQLLMYALCQTIIGANLALEQVRSTAH